MHSRSALLALATSQSISVVVTKPIIFFKIDAQIPPVAVVGQYFNFTFSKVTFSSDLPLTYYLENAPSWLNLDSDTRTLFGTPSTPDIGDVYIEVNAEDANGGTKQDVKLVVLEQNLLEGKANLLGEKISREGNCSAPFTLLLYPQEPFNLDFGPEIFSVDKFGTQYYAQSAEHSPLPAWISFNADTISLSGTTPSLLTPQSCPQNFGLALIASRVAGFSQSALNFEIAVTNHILAFLDPLQKLSGVAGDEILIPPLVYGLRRDGAFLNYSAVRLLSSSQPDWLILNDLDLSLSGIIPKDSNITRFEISVIDNLRNIATTQIQIITSSPTSSLSADIDLGLVNATKGQYFVYTLGERLVANGDYQIGFDPEVVGIWLNFNQSNMTLYGNVPLTETEAVINVSMTVRQHENILRIEHLAIALMNNTNEVGIAAPGPSTSGPDATVLPGPSPSRISAPKLSFIIVFPILAGMTLGIVVVFLFNKYRKKRMRISSAMVPVTESSVLQREAGSSRSSSGNILILAESLPSSEATPIEPVPPSPPPRVDLSWNIHTGKPTRLLSATDQSRLETPTTRSSWELMLMEVEGSTGHAFISSVDHPPSAKPSTLTSPSNAACRSIMSGGERRKQAEIMSRSSNIHHATRAHWHKKHSIASTNDRRKSGIGHGMIVGGANVDVNATLRPVPLSTSAETAFCNNIKLSGQSRSEIPQESDVRPSVEDNLQQDEEFTGWGTFEKAMSISSNDSRFDSPVDSSGPRLCIHRSTEFRSERESDSAWEDEDWHTESSVSQSSSSHQYEMTVGYRPPPIVSHGGSLRTAECGQSQSNSLRFL